jgi:hypothetical protein
MTLSLKGVIQGQLNLSDRENCFLASYWRAATNVDTLMGMTNISHWQAIAMLARLRTHLRLRL